MSPPLWLREPLNDRKKMKAHIKNVSGAKSSEHAVSFADLEAVTLENTKLSSENTCIKSEIISLRKENERLLAVISTNKGEFEKDLNKLQDKIRLNENNLIENSKKCLMQQKEFLNEIKELKATKDQLLRELQDRELIFTKKIENLENELKLLQEDLKNLKLQNKETIEKSSKYKGKLKYALAIINDLNNMLAECASKSQVIHKECQTTERRNEKLKAQTTKTLSKKIIKDTEDMILSDIFFISRVFSENELVTGQSN